MGHGYLEAVYQECLELEFASSNIPFSAHERLTLKYKGIDLRSVYVPDFLCFDKIIIEIKGTSTLTDDHRAQLHNYLTATEPRLGMLINFGSHPKLSYERIIR